MSRKESKALVIVHQLMTRQLADGAIAHKSGASQAGCTVIPGWPECWPLKLYCTVAPQLSMVWYLILSKVPPLHPGRPAGSALPLRQSALWQVRWPAYPMQGSGSGLNSPAKKPASNVCKIPSGWYFQPSRKSPALLILQTVNKDLDCHITHLRNLEESPTLNNSWPGTY